RRRHGSDLYRPAPDARADRVGGAAGGRRRDRVVDPVGRAQPHRAAPDGAARAERPRGRARRHRRHHPGRRHPEAEGDRRERRVPAGHADAGDHRFHQRERAGPCVELTADRRRLQVPRSSADITKVPHTLLLADDSVTIQRVIELTFADEDVAVVAVSDGDQAIARLESQPPDIVLADVGMPGKNGYEVAQYIKRTPRLSHIPVVLLTGAFEPVDQARAADAGCDGVLAKPFEPQLVIGRVKELLGRPRPGGTAAVAGAEPAPKPPQAAAPASEPPQPMPIHPPLRPEAPAAVPDAQELANYF